MMIFPLFSKSLHWRQVHHGEHVFMNCCSKTSPTLSNPAGVSLKREVSKTQGTVFHILLLASCAVNIVQHFGAQTCF